MYFCFSEVLNKRVWEAAILNPYGDESDDLLILQIFPYLQISQYLQGKLVFHNYTLSRMLTHFN